MKKNFFTLSRRNQKGQVAIFVALIFQVIFVFFAVLINVGLLVHHKINLQQSTDLAAYYGAMKQAELMNAIAHVNFQMRQAWKLLTWRYRVVGTFGFQDWAGAQAITFPLSVSLGNTPTTFNGPAAEFNKCPSGSNILDVPFFCYGHSGFASWKSTAENNCRLNCNHLEDLNTSVSAIPLTSGHSDAYLGSYAVSVNNALTQANSQIQDLCNDLGPASFATLALYIKSYSAEVQKKKKLIQMLGASLSAAPNAMVDLNGGAVEAGATKTFDNNLTDANLKGKIKFETLNGLAQGGDCAFKGDSTDGADANLTKQFLKEIKFEGIQFFIHRCTKNGSQANSVYSPTTMYTDGSLDVIRDDFFPAAMSPADRIAIQNGLVGTEFIIGYEKNPWCQVYYAAKAQAEPKIPFLPLSKIRLSAVSVAKPFGGTIGPRYHAFWPQGSQTSAGGPKVDPTLPERRFSGIPTNLIGLAKFQTILLNYSNYVADTKGLKDPAVVAAYQDLLLYRSPNQNLSAGSLNISIGKEIGSQAGSNIGLQHPGPTGWPDVSNWNKLVDPTSVTDYDYIARNRDGTANSFLRDLELTVAAPNQFDLNYYSIDPDFYNNYYLKLKGGSAGPLNYGAGSFDSLKNAAKGNGPARKEDIDADYGFSIGWESNPSIARGFSVRHQIAIAANVIKTAMPQSVGVVPYSETFKFIPNKASSLLTGWTFRDFSNYAESNGGKFPNIGPDLQNTMTFGKCSDANWNNTADSAIDKNFDTPVSSNLPPTPGNCVTGGRTGYSVKIVSPSMLRSGAPPQDYAGDGSNGTILNQIDDNFFNFSL